MPSDHLNLLENSPEEQGREENCFPASFAQERIWFLQKLDPGSPVYNIAGAVRLNGDLDQEALKSALKEIVRRHEILRTSFVEINGQPFQKVHHQVRLQFATKDLLETSNGIAAGKSIQSELQEEARRGFILSEPGLLRARLLQIAEREHLLVVVMHHIIADGWTIGILAGELKELYEAYREGRPSPLPELEIQYLDYAA